MQPVPEVSLFPTCIVDAVKPEIGFATAHILERMGYAVAVPDAATCCGQPAWNAGHAEAAAEVARTTLEALAETGQEIVVPAGSCATMIRVFWRELFELHGDAEDRELVANVAARTFELSEFMDARGAQNGDIDDPESVVYHRSCHMQRELGIVEQPEAVLDTYVADRRRSASEGRCCGFGGMFSIKLPEASVAMADEVLDSLAATGAARVVSCDASCLMQLEGRAARRGMDLAFVHLAEVADRATGSPT
jgi:L-lactate dehydrogenase complex protein LldE